MIHLFTASSLIPITHIQRAIHAFYSDVTERALQMMLTHPELAIEAERIVRKSNLKLAQFIGRLKSQNWEKLPPKSLQDLCREAELDSLFWMEVIQNQLNAVKSMNHNASNSFEEA